MNILRRLDWSLNGAIFVLAAASLLSLASSSPQLAWRQLLWYIIGVLILVAAAHIDWRPFINDRGFAYGIYFSSILLLGLVYFLAPPIRGVRSWMIAGPVQFQPSEFAKIALIVIYAYFFARHHVSIARFKVIFFSFFLFILPAGLVALQPDFGTALILFGVWFGFLLISGIRWRHLAIAVFVLSILGFFLWNYSLQAYQEERILGLFFPERDPLGINYGVIQSKIAIGSGDFFGKGFRQGTQVQLNFLPEATNDFIFAAFVEEWGLLGGFIVIAAIALIILRIINIGPKSSSNFFRFFCLGTVILLLFHFVLNIGSNLGLTPVVGVSYPFLSYGGSNLLTNFLLVGIIQSIKVRG